ncbi:MAG: hypothetical protein JXA54_14415, partial [Candidatus Heimdallarchaeota archaeon]|nr:hypothetical protein [Candidatus Heimdallarchaeota archaeon]
MEQLEKRRTGKRSEKFREISFRIGFIKENKLALRKSRIVTNLSIILLVFAFSIASGSFSPFYFFLNSTKMILFISSIMALAYISIGDLAEVNDWNVRTNRKSLVAARTFHVLKEILLMFIISCVLFGIIHLSGLPRKMEADFLVENPGQTFPLKYRPVGIELALLVLIYIFQLVSCFTSIYWLYLRTTQFVGFSEKKKTLQINLKRFLFAVIFAFVSWFIINCIILDELFIATKFPGILASWSKFETVFASHAYVLL